MKPSNPWPTDGGPDLKVLEDCVGALQFILAFYEPGQTYLDTEAWKNACARGVDAYQRGAAAIGWHQAWMRGSTPGTVERKFEEMQS